MANQPKITKKQKVLLDFIDGFTDNQGFSPSYREIAEALGCKSIATVAEHINNLVALDLIRKNDGAARSLEVIKPDQLVLALDKQIAIRLKQLDQLELASVKKAFKILNIAELNDLIEKTNR